METGHHTLSWDGTDQHGNLVSSGVYLVELSAPEKMDRKKILLVR